jgi:L-threonylcarbamoyladenylate synthase
MLRLTVDGRNPDRATLERAAGVIRSGGIVAVPTDTLYGLAADPFSAEAVARVFAAKNRLPRHPLPLIASDLSQVCARLGPLSDLASRLADRYWPGPLTLLVLAPAGLASAVAGGTGRVGVRVPAHAVARGLCRASDRPLTATSANISGEQAPYDPDEAAKLERIEVLLDAGPTPGGPPSTIVDAIGDRPHLVRAGAIPWEEIQAWLLTG